MNDSTASELSLFETKTARAIASAREARNRLTRKIEAAEQRVARLGEIAEAFEGLKTAWSTEDPGKYRTAYFFRAAKDGARVVARELLPPETKIFTEAGWEKYLAANRALGFSARDFRFSPYDGVPPQYPVVPIVAVEQKTCTRCGEVHPVIERYAQTDDGPDGDAWRRDLILLCPRKQEIIELDTRVSPNRF